VTSLRRRRYVLAGLLVAVGLLAAAILREVLETVFFAVTVAYVLYPIRQRFVARGLSRRVASALVTVLAFVAVVVLLAPVAWTIFRRRQSIVDFLRNLPDEIYVHVGGTVVTVDAARLVDTAAAFLRDLAGSLALSSAVIALQFAMFTFLLYGLLLRPSSVERAAFELVPSGYHDVVRALHRRTAGTLYALYIIQAATAALTFPVAVAVFYGLGYESAFVLAVVSAILQFIPIIGPGMLAVGLAAYDVVVGVPQRAIAVLILGPTLIGLLPDVVVRPRLATRQANLPASLYFVGFVGGVLTVGVIGVIAGPLVVALLVEVVDLLSEDRFSLED
jgi:predicted PurR-regulated permease PerM